MDEQNIVHRMLAKGDVLREKYKDFDFSQLDDTQIKYLNRLAFFSRHRERILRKFNGTRISYDVKIAFLDQHSMKLGNHIFYDLESKRQDYLTCFDLMPFTTGFLGKFMFEYDFFRSDFLDGFRCEESIELQALQRTRLLSINGRCSLLLLRTLLQNSLPETCG